jgi:hypothetical protein
MISPKLFETIANYLSPAAVRTVLVPEELSDFGHRSQTSRNYAVASKSSRPISMRRISEVPAPIS